MGDDVLKSIGQIAASIGGAILGTALMPGAGTFLGAMGGGALGGAAGGAAGNALGSLIFKQKAPGLSDTLLSAGGGALGGGLGAFGQPGRLTTSAPTMAQTFASEGIGATAGTGTEVAAGATKGMSDLTKQMLVAGAVGSAPVLAKSFLGGDQQQEKKDLSPLGWAIARSARRRIAR